ncbi:MAG: UMP kinase [Candidatus Poseidoniaceae archaeon]|jgi:uridylate kinase|tara:strand:+ start:34826 stop:35533 length:708 start_codon:yes stop_codon:yes gene_type:complete
MTTRHVVALGGSLLRPEEAEQRIEWFGRLRQLAVHMEGNGRHLGLVVGGGLPAREGITLAQALVSETHRLDEIGIAATRLNATVIQQILLDIGCDVAPIIATTTSEAAALMDVHHIVVMGGTTPGHTTDAVAVALARDTGASHCVIATNVSHVFDKDPRHHEDAVSFTSMTIDELAEITGIDEPLAPGASAVIDPVAVGWAKACDLRLAVLDGRDLNLLEKALDGQPFDGTLIVP